MTHLQPISIPFPRETCIRMKFDHVRNFMPTNCKRSLWLFHEAAKISERKKKFLCDHGTQEIESSKRKMLVNRADPVSEVNDEIVETVEDLDVVPAIEAAKGDEASPRVQMMTVEPGRISMAGVVTGTMDEEKLDGSRVGFSGRTRRMEQLLEQEMKQLADNAGLSYTKLCRRQARKDRGRVAGCFFELLVLKTNGFINVSQQQAYGDILVTKGTKWGQSALKNIDPGNFTVPVENDVPFESHTNNHKDAPTPVPLENDTQPRKKRKKNTASNPGD